MNQSVTLTRSRLNFFIDAILRRPWLVIALATLVMIVLASGGRFITVTNDYRVMFGPDNPELAAYNEFQQTYSASNSALIAIAPSEGSVFNRKTLIAIEELTEQAWHVPYSNRVDSLTNFPYSEAVDDDLIVEPLVDDAQSLTDADLIRIEKAALSSDEIAGYLIAHDGRVGALTIHFVLPDNWDSTIVEITDYLDAMLDQARADHPDINYYATGDIILSRTLATATQDDFLVLAPIGFLIILVTTILILRSVLCTLAINILVLFIVATAMGAAGWVGTQFNPLSAIVPIIVMAMSVAHSVHIVTATQNGLRRGLDRKAAIAESLRSNAYPIFLTTVTTMIGFLSLNASDSPPFHVLGNCVAFGVLCAFVYCMTLLPAVLLVLPLRAPALRAGKSEFFERFGAFVTARSKFLLWSVSLVVVLLILGIPRNELTDAWAHYFDDRYEFRRDTDFIIDNLAGIDILEYSLESGSDGGITNPEYLRAIDAFAQWQRSQPEVSHVQVFSDTMKRLNRNLHGDDPAFHRLPEDQSLAAQYLLLYELSLPFGSDLNNRINVTKSATRMSVVTGTVSSLDHRELGKRSQIWLQENFPEIGMKLSGTTTIFAHLSQRNIDSMLRSTIIAMALISFILIGIFKSLRLGLISLIPNFIPAAMSFGLWGYTIGKIGISASVVTIVAFGIIVDDTIHFLSKYIKARREDGLSSSESVVYAFRTVGKALFTTTSVLSIGFLVFISSGYVGSWALGLLIAITLVFALIADFLLLPSLLVVIDRKKL